MKMTVKDVLSDDFWIMPATPEYMSNGVPYITSKNIKNGQIDFEKVNYITQESYEIISKNRPILVGDILISMIGTLGETAEVKESDGSFYGQNMFLVRLNEEKVNKRYFLNYFKSNAVKRAFEVSQNKSTQKYLKANHIEDLVIPIPKLVEQIKISSELDKLSEIIQMRQQELQKLDELIKARFVEMFGDVEDAVRLGDCCEVHARIGWQALTKDEHMQNGEYMLVTGTDFIDGRVNYDTCVYVAKERYEMDPHIILKENDVLITKDGSIGKVAVVHNLPKPATLNGGVFVVRPDEIFNKEYISYVFRGPFFERFVDLSKTGATIKHLNQKHLVEFAIPLPSIEKQEAFARFSKQLDKSKVAVQKALDEAQLLFDSLMQEYFG